MISLVIPTRRIGDSLEKCIKSLEGEYDELVIVDDDVENLSTKINMGINRSTHDYIIVSNDDIELESGHLKDLCGDTVISPEVIDGLTKAFHAHMWCIPRWIYKKIGPMHEGYHIARYDDSDYWMTMLNNDIVPIINHEVRVWHKHPASTLKTFKIDDSYNRQHFIDRWGYPALSVVEAL